MDIQEWTTRIQRQHSPQATEQTRKKHNTENYTNVQHYITQEPEVNPDACEE
jgi:hypothetical protein